MSSSDLATLIERLEKRIALFNGARPGFDHVIYDQSDADLDAEIIASLRARLELSKGGVRS